MIIRWIIVLFVAFLAAIWDATVASFLPPWLQVTFIIPMAFFCFFTERYKHALVVLFMGAFFQDVYRWTGTGLYTIRWLIFYLFFYYALERVFTNRSLYVSWFLVCVFYGLNWVVSLFLQGYHRFPIEQLAWSLLLTMAGYGLMMTNRGKWIQFKHQRYGA